MIITNPPPCAPINIEVIRKCFFCILDGYTFLTIEVYSKDTDELIMTTYEERTPYFLFGDEGDNVGEGFRTSGNDVFNGGFQPGRYYIRTRTDANSKYSPNVTFTIQGTPCYIKLGNRDQLVKAV
jgi:hypothetical protein